jgi:hypothetical protein
MMSAIPLDLEETDPVVARELHKINAQLDGLLGAINREGEAREEYLREARDPTTYRGK